MRLISLEFESKLREKGLWPQSWVAWAALYVLALDLLLFAVQGLTRGVSPATVGEPRGLGNISQRAGDCVARACRVPLAASQLLWRLRNRLIVTYVFIGVIPIFLLVMISLITLYLLAGQFASFVVTSEIASRLRSMEASNRAIAKQIANRYSRGETLSGETIGGMRPQHREWARRQVCVWYGNQAEPQLYGAEWSGGVQCSGIRA